MLRVSLLIEACSILTSFHYFQGYAAVDAKDPELGPEVTCVEDLATKHTGRLSFDKDFWALSDIRTCYGATFHLLGISPLPSQDSACTTSQGTNSKPVTHQESCETECKQFEHAHKVTLDRKARVAAGKAGKCIRSMVGTVVVTSKASPLPKNPCTMACTCEMAVTIPRILMPLGSDSEGKLEVSPCIPRNKWQDTLVRIPRGLSCEPKDVGKILVSEVVPRKWELQVKRIEVANERETCLPLVRPAEEDMCKCSEKSPLRRPICPAPVSVNSLRQPSSSQQYDDGLCQTQQQFFENSALSMSDWTGLPYVPYEAYPPVWPMGECPELSQAEMEACRMVWDSDDADGQSTGQNGHSGSAQLSSAAGQNAHQWQEPSSGPGGQQWGNRGGTSSVTQPSTEGRHRLTDDEMEQLKQQTHWQDSLGTDRDPFKEQYLYDFM